MTASLPFSVTAPASSGNLGPGFDVLAMALDLRNVVRVSAGTGAVSIEGRDSDVLPADATNLVARAFEQAAGLAIADAKVDLACRNDIPPARGLGSSTAAAACGLVAGWHHAEIEWDGDQLFEALAALDGHPDNAAACAYGGVVLCHGSGSEGDEHVEVITLGPVDWITPIAVVPDRQLETHAARAALPDHYARRDVVRAISASALLAAGLVGGHPELLEDALHGDVVHEQQRAALVPELAEVRASAAHTNALGATLSGAGPTVLLWCEPDDVEQALGTLAIDHPELELLTLSCEPEGVLVASR